MKTMPISLTIIGFFIVLILGCIEPSSDNTENNPESNINPVYFTINIHIEPGSDGHYCNNETYYNNGKLILGELMDIAEGIGAKLSVFTEYPFLYGAIKYESPDNNILTELIQRGHSVGFHSHYNSGIFQDDSSNLCDCEQYPKVYESNYLDYFEYLFKEALGTENIYAYTKAGYGAFGESVKEFQSNGLEVVYKESCGYPEAGENAVYDIEVEQRQDLIYIPVPKPAVYLSTIYTRSPNLSETCFIPYYADTAICGKWYPEDFTTVYSAIEKATELSEGEQGVFSTGITFHLHNFDDESKQPFNCGKDVIYPNYQELDMFEEWLINEILPLENEGKIIFATANEIVEFIKKNQ